MSEEEITKIGKSFLDLVTKIRFKMTRFDLLFFNELFLIQQSTTWVCCCSSAIIIKGC
jgi:hypothetical protein